MKLTKISSLSFSLPEHILDTNIQSLKNSIAKLETLTKKAGTSNPEYEQALASVKKALQTGKDLASEIDSNYKIRALYHLIDEESYTINLTKRLFARIDYIRPIPSLLFIETIYQHYLTEYDQLAERETTAKWLLKALSKHKLNKDYHKYLLDADGPKWLAQQAISNDCDFNNQLHRFKIENYAAGSYLTIAKNLYYVEQLKNIPENKPHKVLAEVQNKTTYESKFDNTNLVGHKVLEILIQRAPTSDIDDSWLDVIRTIAGDPRIPKTHTKYQKWWSQMSYELMTKARKWFSGFDLRLFLEALENYSNISGNYELQRMYPSRKRFLKGMFDKGLITDTRLYLSRGAKFHLKEHYDKEHLSNFSQVTDGDKSIIYVQLDNGNSHMIEGSHNCYLYIYKNLSENAIVFNDEQRYASYYSLTARTSLR